MDILSCDFETYYDKEYSLSKMTTQEYIMDARFEALLLAYTLNGQRAEVVEGPDIRAFFNTIDWGNTIFNAHNTIFDGAILRWKYGHSPRMYTDTMSMARSLGLSMLGSVSLANITTLFQEAGFHIESKGTAVVNALGRRREHFSEAGWAEYRAYCAHDTWLTDYFARMFYKRLPPAELQFQDIILRCFIEPQFILDLPVIEQELERVRDRKANILNQVATTFQTQPDTLAMVLRSNDKFAQLLKALGGVTKYDMDMGEQGSFLIPEKISPSTGNLTWAFGKTDEGFQILADSKLPAVSDLCEARLSEKSSIEETRAERFVKLAQMGFLAIPYNISGAHTHRLSGANKINLQNLSSGRKEGQTTALRDSIIAPAGHVVVCYDSSQIECRTLAWVAGQQDLLDIFKSGDDPYSHMAADIYGEDATTIFRNAKAGVAPYSNLYRPMGKQTVLACGYGMGHAKFQVTCITMAGISISGEEAKRVVSIYRKKNSAIVQFWKMCDHVLKEMIAGNEGYFGGSDGNLLYYQGSRTILDKPCAGIRLPDGLWLNYPDLRYSDNEIVYSKMEGRAKTPKPIKVYGGKLAENITQALAFSVMKDAALKISTRYTVKLNTHDEHAIIVPESEAEDAKAFMSQCMSTPPVWATDLPLGCEGGYHQSYGKI